MKSGLTCIAAAASLALAAGIARADTYKTYDLAWSGAEFGNSATATGTMTLDLSTLINPTTAPGGLDGSSYYDIVADITALSVTVTGAGAGDGTYTLADLCACSSDTSFTYWNTNGDSINMSGNVLSQLEGDVGDFNLFFTSPGPIGVFPLGIAADGGEGDDMLMTEFAPVGAPEPSTWIMIGLGVFGLGAALRRTRRAVTAAA